MTDDSCTGDMDHEDLLDSLENQSEKMAWFLREMLTVYEETGNISDAADELFYEIHSEPPTNIEYHLTIAVLFGVLWEKNDDESDTGTKQEDDDAE